MLKAASLQRVNTGFGAKVVKGEAAPVLGWSVTNKTMK